MDLLVYVGSTCYHAFTAYLSTRWSFWGLIGNCNLECGFALNMLSALIRSELSYSAMLLVQQLTHQRFVHPGPLVLGAATLTIPTRPHRI